MGNVTYTISNDEPQTSGEEFLLLPLAEKIRRIGARVYTSDQRRPSLGALVYTVDKSSASTTGNAMKLFEVGQVLEFADEVADEVSSNLVGRELTLQHNTNLLDLEGLGLTEAEVTQVESQSAALKEQLDNQLVVVLNNIADNETIIANTQKSINEANKAMAALGALGDIELFNRVSATKDELVSEQSALIVVVNGQIAQSQSLRDQILSVSQLVR